MKAILKVIVFLALVTLGTAILGNMGLLASSTGLISNISHLQRDNSFDACARVEASVTQQRREIRDLFLMPIISLSGVIAALALAGLIVESRKHRKTPGQPAAAADALTRPAER